MLENFSKKSVLLIEKAKKLYLDDYEQGLSNETFCSTIYLLIALAESLETICHFLLTELKIEIKQLPNLKNEVKKEDQAISFSKQFEQIIKEASKIATIKKAKYVYDEHIFYASLILNNNQICEALNLLKVDIKQMIEDIEDIFNFDENESSISYLTKLKPNVIHPYIDSYGYKKRLLYILNKLNKANPLLIGMPGVGKTSLVEAITKDYPKDIYALNLTRMLAGTKYRGEMEERITEACEYCIDNNIIMFIDEIHTSISCGNQEGSLDVANILKPYISNHHLNVIGCTTYDEYEKYLMKDKAFLRRFHPLFIKIPRVKETIKIIMKVKTSYEKHYHYHLTKYDISTLVKKVTNNIFDKVNPDISLDILDEVLSRIKIDNINFKQALKQTINDYLGITINKYYKPKLNFKHILSKNKCNLGLIEIKDNPIFKILKEDLINLFNISEDNFLIIDQEAYLTKESLTSLTGTTKGYLGYEEGGMLYKHLKRYQPSIIYITNYTPSKSLFNTLISNLIAKPKIIDYHDQIISLKSTLFIFRQKTKSHLGFNQLISQQPLDFVQLILK